MTDTSKIKEHMEVIGADGIHVGKVDRVEGDRIKLTKRELPRGKAEHHRYVSAGLVAEVEGDKVRLSATAANALMLQEDNARSKNGGSAQMKGNRSSAKSNEGLPWKTIGAGVAALAAVGAVGKTIAGRKNDDSDKNKSKFQLETDENVRLIASEKVEGTRVIGSDDAKLGTIKSFMVDKYTGRVAYAVMSFGGTMGFGTSLFPVPWSMLDYDDAEDGYVLNVTKEQMSRAPKFEASDAPEFDVKYRQRVSLYYRGV